MARFDILDNVRVATPCPMQWEDMCGDERRRFCDQCERHVYDISSMSSDEARLFLIEHEGRVCVTFFRRADGRLITKDCDIAVRIRKSRFSYTLAHVGLLGALAILGLSVWGFMATIAPRAVRSQSRQRHERTLGQLAPRGPKPEPKVVRELTERLRSAG